MKTATSSDNYIRITISLPAQLANTLKENVKKRQISSVVTRALAKELKRQDLCNFLEDFEKKLPIFNKKEKISPIKWRKATNI